MIIRTLDAGVAVGWVTGNEAYGKDAGGLRGPLDGVSKPSKSQSLRATSHQAPQTPLARRSHMAHQSQHHIPVSTVSSSASGAVAATRCCFTWSVSRWSC